MDVYYFVIIVTLFLCYAIKIPYGNQSAYIKKVIWVFIPILIFGALRVNFGNDYGRYEELYYHYHSGLQNIDEEDHSELGYQLLNYLIPSWRLLLILVSTTVVAGFIVMYSKYVEPKYLMLAMFFTMFYPDHCFFLQFVSMRNGLAIAGTWLCLPLIVKRKYWIVLLIAVGLMYMHTSAIFFLPMALFFGRNVALTKTEIFMWINLIVFLCFISTTVLADYLTPLLVSDQFDSYKRNYFGAEDNHNTVLNCSANACLMYCIISWAYRNRKVLTEAQNTIWRISMLFLISPFIGTLGRTRMIYYYIPFYIITITYLAKDTWPQKWQKKIFFALVVAVMLYATFVVWLNNPYNRYQHYQSLFI